MKARPKLSNSVVAPRDRPTVPNADVTSNAISTNAPSWLIYTKKMPDRTSNIDMVVKTMTLITSSSPIERPKVFNTLSSAEKGNRGQ